MEPSVELSLTRMAKCPIIYCNSMLHCPPELALYPNDGVLLQLHKLNMDIVL